MTENLGVWHDELQAVLNATTGPLKEVVFLRATDSTQDAARRMRAEAGQVVITARQTSGRGRLGRSWADTMEEGIAVTFVLPREAGGRYAIAGSIAASMAAEQFLAQAVNVKWPNDVIFGGKKLAGVLVEQVDDVALIGIGMNVLQTSWPGSLAETAVSLSQAGATCDRLGVLKSLLTAADAVFQMDDACLTGEFAARDGLLGTTATFFDKGIAVTGKVMCLEPLKGLLVRNAEGDHWLDAATTSMTGR